MKEEGLAGYLRGKGILWPLLILLFLVIGLACSIGEVSIPVLRVFRIILSEIPLADRFVSPVEGSDSTIILLVRLPRVLLGVIAGMGLAASGVSMQGIFKNPMASPFVLGISTGGAFGLAVGFLLNLDFFLLPFTAFLGGMGTVLFVLMISKSQGGTDMITLILAGLAVNFFMGSLYGLIWHLSPQERKVALTSWIWGSFEGSIWKMVIITLPILLVSLFMIYAHSRELNVIQTGEESALQLGIDVERTKNVQIVVASLLTSSIVAFTGVISFVGLIIPHGARLLVGPDHKRLLPVSAIIGGIFLVLCDTLSRYSSTLPISGIPVGILTGMIGTPFFFFLLIKNRGETGW